MTHTDIDRYAASLRKEVVLPSEKKILIARLGGSEQEKDLAVPVNCRGYGRIKHFRWFKFTDWSPYPIPNLPIARALKHPPEVVLRAQTFQLAACNWHCWYCYVDDDRRSASLHVSEYFSPSELIDMFLKEKNRIEVIYLSGGQPDLAPEWILWTLEALEERGLDDKIFVWSDNNLSNKYFWKFLTREQRQSIANFSNYARDNCFKGYDEKSFSFNTSADPRLFHQQFEIFRDLLQEGLDMYASVTLTSLPNKAVRDSIKRFIDKLQSIHRNLPLRMVPLKVKQYNVTRNRIKENHRRALAFQHEVHKIWLEELSRRFSKSELNLPICDVPLTID